MTEIHSQITQVDREGYKKDKEMEHTLKSVVTLVVTGAILFVFDVHAVMIYSNRLNHIFLYLSYACYTVFILIAAYLHFFVGSDAPWEDTHLHLIYAATIITLSGGLFWIIALWPVFHFWTFPLGIAAIFFCISVLDWIPIGKSRKKEM